MSGIQSLCHTQLDLAVQLGTCLGFTLSYTARLSSTTKVIIFLLENGKFEFSRKQYIFLKHSKREFCAEFYYHF
jgi:hypothetical protein